eukprot:2938011-Karenia_brevis.AAC.1
MHGRYKVKIVVDPHGSRTNPWVRQALLAVMDHLLAAAATSCVHDRGHTHSNGLRKMHFWFAPAPATSS